VHVVAPSHAITVLACATLDDVATGVSRFMVVGGGLRGRSYPVSPGRLGMNRSLSLLSRGLDEPLRGGLASPRGRALGLLHGSSLEEFSDFVLSPTGVEVRWLGHVAEEHGGGNDVLAGSSEDRGVGHPVLIDVTVDVVGPLASPSAKCAFRALTLEGLLE
jgi:hypothetical protein